MHGAQALTALNLNCTALLLSGGLLRMHGHACAGMHRRAPSALSLPAWPGGVGDADAVRVRVNAAALSDLNLRHKLPQRLGFFSVGLGGSLFGTTVAISHSVSDHIQEGSFVNRPY